MRILLMAICFIGFLASNGVAAVVDRWVEGKSSNCTCDQADPEENHDSWRYPHLSFLSDRVTRSVNREISQDVLKALELPSFPVHTRECECEDDALRFDSDDDCEATHVSDRYVTLLCSTEVRQRHGKGGINYRTILFKISGNRSTRVTPSDLFRNDAAVEAVQNTLAKKIKDDYKEGLKDGNSSANIDEADIPELAAKMFDSAVLADGGVKFMVLGEGHSAFEALLTHEELRKYVVFDVLKELTSFSTRRRKGQL
jgi:hypothetical protein